MIRSRMLSLGLFGAGLSLALAAAPLPAAAQQSSNSATPAFGKAIQDAEGEMNAGNLSAANRDLETAEAQPGKNAYESFVIVQMRGALAAKSGDYAAAVGSYIAQVNSGRLDASTALNLTGAIAGLEFTLKNYAEAATWADRYYRMGGSDQRFKEMQIQAHYLNNDFATAGRMQQARVNAEIKAHQTPSDDEFGLLYSCALNQKDSDGVIAVLDQAVIYYPKPEYWTQLINNVTNGNGFDPERLEYDSGLLMVDTKSIGGTADWMNLIQVSLQGGHSGMAQKLFDQATAAGILGTGAAADVAREQRLRALIATTVASDKAGEAAAISAAANDGDKAATEGYNLVDLGQPDQGIALMEKSLNMTLSTPDITRLRLGEAYAEVGRKQDAINMFNTVGGTNGTAGLAKLWMIHLSQKA